MNFYPHHIGDYRSDTAHLSNEEDLAYRRLLEMYYDTERPIPLETQWVARRLRVGAEAIQSVLSDFFFSTEEGWRHYRCDRVLNEYHELQERNRANGRKGGRPKAKNPNENNPLGSDSVASGMPAETNREGNQKPVTNNQEPLKGESAVAPPPPKKPKEPAIVKPESVDQQTWSDWLSLRKAKKAPVTETVVNGAKSEADKAGIGLEEFLQIWCRRGSQGLEASWIKPSEKFQPTGMAQQESFSERDERKKREWFDEASGRSTTPLFQGDVIDISARSIAYESADFMD